MRPTGGGKIKVTRWPLASPSGKTPSRFRFRQAKYGRLVVVPADELAWLIETAETRCRQLSLPLEMRKPNG